MQTFKRGGVVARWAGTVGDLVDSARLTASLVSKVANRDMSSEVRTLIDTQTYDDDPVGIAGLEEALARDEDLDLIKRISIQVGAKGGAAHVLLIFQRDDPAAIYGVGGWDRTWVEGSRTELAEALHKRGQRHWWEPWLIDSFLAVLIWSMALVVAETVFITVSDDYDSLGPLWLIGLIPTALLLLYLVVARVLTRYLIPLELVPEGGQTKWQRERRRALGVMGSAAGIVFAAIVYALATRLFG